MSEARETAWKYTREYIRLRKQTNRLLREGIIDKQDADHRTANAKQFLLFAKFRLENANKTSNPVLPGELIAMSGSSTDKTSGTLRNVELNQTTCARAPDQ